MKLKRLDCDLTVCKLPSLEGVDFDADFCFIAKTDEELSLVCRTDAAPANALAREDGWKGFRVQGPLDFSLIGILSGLSGVLAENGIGLFAVSTYDTDYILVKKENFSRAADVLAKAGYEIA